MSTAIDNANLTEAEALYDDINPNIDFDDEDHREYLDGEKKVWLEKLKDLTGFTLHANFKDALEYTGDLEAKAEIKDEIKVLLDNPERYTLVSPESGEYYYKLEIPGLNGLEIHIIGTIAHKVDTPSGNVIENEKGSETNSPDNLFMSTRSIVIGNSETGYLNLLEKNKTIVDLAVGKDRKVKENWFEQDTKAIRVGQIVGESQLFTLFHELGHFVDFVKLSDNFTIAERNILQSVLYHPKLSQGSEMDYALTAEEIISVIVNHEKREYSERSKDDEDITMMDYQNDVEALDRFKTIPLDTLMGMAISTKEYEERFASQFGLYVTQALVNAFELPNRLNDAAKEHYNNAWKTYDHRRIKDGFSDDVRKSRSLNDEDSKKEIDFVMETDRLKANIRKVFPLNNGKSVINWLSLDDAIFKGKPVKCDLDIQKDDEAGPYYKLNFYIYFSSISFNLLFLPATLTEGSAIIFKIEENDVVKKRSVNSTGEIDSFQNVENYNQTMQALRDINDFFEGGPDANSHIDLARKSSYTSLLEIIFKEVGLVKEYREVGDIDLAKVYKIDPKDLNKLHFERSLVDSIYRSYLRIFPDLEKKKVPDFDDDDRIIDERRFLDHITREFLLRNGSKDIPRVGTWNMKDSIKYYKRASGVVQRKEKKLLEKL